MTEIAWHVVKLPGPGPGCVGSASCALPKPFPRIGVISHEDFKLCWKSQLIAEVFIAKKNGIREKIVEN